MFDFGAQRNLPAVMLIDDDMVSREVMATVLTMSGYTVHTAVDGAASLELLASGACVPSVILMDAQMPGLSGAQLIKELRASCLASVYTMSGSNPPDEVIAASDGFLLKPFGPEALQKLLEDHAAKTMPPARPVPDSAEPVVNARTLAQLRELMPDTAVRQIYTAVVTDLFKRHSDLEAAVAKGDAAEIRRIGHAIKGGCGMAGASQAARLGALLEGGILESKGNQLDNSSHVLQDLSTAAANLKRMLEAEFPG